MAFAADCRCFCGDSNSGAVDFGSISDATGCREGCAYDNYQYVGCFEDEDEYPENSDICWTERECEDDDANNEWNDYVTECSDEGPYHMGHCYSAPRTVSVMTAINGETKFTGIADYVSALYQLLIPAMAIVAVVMLMVGGLQYILSRGSANGVKLAKERIKNAVIGMVLLLSAYSLANLLDPSLTHIKQLRIPKVKAVLMLNANDTCEYLSSVGYGIDGGQGQAVGRCGAEGEITSTDLVDPQVIAGAWEVGDTCQYSTCMDADAGKTCILDAGEPTCISCSDIYDGSSLAPNDASCGRASYEERPGTETGNKTLCAYIEDTSGWTNARPDSVVTINELEGGSCMMAGTSVATLDCTVLRSGTGGGSCRDYDTVDLYVAGVKISDIESAAWKAESFEYFEELCTSDPCGLAGDGHSCELGQPSELTSGYMTASKLNCMRDDQATNTYSQGNIFWTEPATPCYGRRGNEEVACN